MSKKSHSRSQKAAPRAASTGLNISRGWIVALTLGLTFAAFANTLFNGFAYDDETQILKNDLIQVSSLRDFINRVPVVMTTEVWYFQVMHDTDPNKDVKPNTGYYRPVFIFYLMLAWSLFNASAGGWHLLSMLMHLIAVYFVFLILEKITKDLRLAAIATLIFALHPARVESVAWISGVTDSLLAALLLPAFYLYMLYRERGKLKHIIAATGLFLFALFAKEPAIALAVFVFAYELFIINREKSIKEKIKPAAAYAAGSFLVSIIYFAMRHKALGYFLHDKKFMNYQLHEVLLTIPLVICKYVGLLLWPVNLSLYHATPVVKSPLDARFILPALALGALGAALWRLRGSLVARFAILWFLVMLLPVLNLSAFPEDFMVQERYLYISAIGFSLLIGLLIAHMPVEKWFAAGNRRVAQTALAALIILLLAGKTVAQNMVWEDSIAVFSHGAKASPDQRMPHFILGHYLLKRQGRDDMPRVVEELEKCISIDSSNLVTTVNLAPAHLQMYERTMDRAHLDRAIALCEKGLKASDEIAVLWDTLGHAYTYETERKNYEFARSCFARALQYQPDNAMINFHMGATYVKQLDFENAMPYLETARQQQPDLPDTHKFLGYAYSNRGQLKEAIDSLSRYLQLQPNALDAAKERTHLETLRARLQQGDSRS